MSAGHVYDAPAGREDIGASQPSASARPAPPDCSWAAVRDPADGEAPAASAGPAGEHRSGSRKTAPPGLVDKRRRPSTIQLIQRAESRVEQIAAAVAELFCPDCTPAEYIEALEAAIERNWRRGQCDHTRYVPTDDGMQAVGENTLGLTGALQ